MIDADCAAYPAPDLDSVFAGGCASNVDFYAANACHCALHGSSEAVMIDELNAYLSCASHASKHMKLFFAENPLTSLKVNDSIVLSSETIALMMFFLLSS